MTLNDKAAPRPEKPLTNGKQRAADPLRGQRKGSRGDQRETCWQGLKRDTQQHINWHIILSLTIVKLPLVRIAIDTIALVYVSVRCIGLAKWHTLLNALDRY